MDATIEVTLDEEFLVTMVAGSELNYGFKWSGVLAPGEAILASAWEIDNSAFNKIGDTVAGTDTLIRIGGGIAGRSAYAKNTVVTTYNRFVKRIHLVCIPG